MVVMVVHIYEYTPQSWTVYLKWVTCGVCELHLSKAAEREENEEEDRRRRKKEKEEGEGARTGRRKRKRRKEKFVATQLIPNIFHTCREGWEAGK